MNEPQQKKTWQNPQLNTAINCLTYGINCLYYQRGATKLKTCLLSIHEQYINILHVIVDGQYSILFELQDAKSISNIDIPIKQSLKQLGYEYFIIVYTSALQSHTLVMQSQNQLNVLWQGLQYFIYQANNFYSRIATMDPFKAETTMEFMNADADGSKLLDIQQVMSIFNKLKINKTRQQILQSIYEINQDLYVKQNLKKPKDLTMSNLTPLGFQYILQYYSLKTTLAPIFTQLCPIFKFKHKQLKKSIIDILKSQSKTLMSVTQFQQFLGKYMKISKSQEECLEIIKSFPIYDGQGQEIPEQVQYLSFHSFCNFVFSSNNSIMEPSRSVIYQDMELPLTEYFIYSSGMSQLTQRMNSLLYIYQSSLQKGCRCVQINIHIQKQQIVVKYNSSKKSVLLLQVLQTIKNKAFSFNTFPLIISIQSNFNVNYSQKVAKIFKNQLGNYLYIPNSKQLPNLPSPIQLKNKIILQLIGNTKRNKQQENQFIKLITLMPTKLDFQRKFITGRDTCHLTIKDIVKHQDIQDKNLTDYCRKVMVRTSCIQTIGQFQNFDPMPMFRNGIQITGHNIQKQDKFHYLIHSKFHQNGGRSCGYLLKPVWMRSNCMESLYASSYNKLLYSLKIKVFSGQKYVLADTTSQKFILQVYLKGTKLEQSKNKRFVCDPKNQGFYTQFQMDCQFFIYCPDLAMIVFTVVDQHQKILSFRAVPVNSIRQGLRTVQLFGPGMQMNLNSCLLVNTILVEDKSKRKVASLLM